jgi:hypothetical protein
VADYDGWVPANTLAHVAGFSSGAPSGGAILGLGTQRYGRCVRSPKRGTYQQAPSGGGSPTLTYTHIAFKVSDNALVRWSHTSVDTTGASYPSGGSGALVPGSVSVVKVE